MPEKTAAQKKAQKAYMEKFVRVEVRMTPDRRDNIQKHAQSTGESVTVFINRAIDHEMERDIASQKEADTSTESEERPPTAFYTICRGENFQIYPKPKETLKPNQFVVQVSTEDIAPRFAHIEVKEPEKVEPVQFKVAVKESEKIEPIRFVVRQSDDKGTAPAASESQTEDDLHEGMDE